MDLPVYEAFYSDIENLYVYFEKNDLFSDVEESNFEGDDNLTEDYRQLRDQYNDIKDAIKTVKESSEKSDEEKNLAWTALWENLDKVFDLYGFFTTGEINDTIQTERGFKKWQLANLAGDIKCSMQMMMAMGKVKESDSSTKEFSSKFKDYVSLSDELDMDLAQYSSFDELKAKRDKIAAEESALKAKVDQYDKEDLLYPLYHDNLVDVYVEKEQKTVKMNYLEVYNHYVGLYNDEQAKDNELEQKISNAIAVLKNNNSDKIKQINTLNVNLKDEQSKYTKLSSSILQIAKLGNAELEMGTAEAELDRYFENLDKEIANRPKWAIRSKTREKMHFEQNRKGYLDNLRAYYKYKDSIFAVNGHLQSLNANSGLTLTEAAALGKKLVGQNTVPSNPAEESAMAVYLAIKPACERFIAEIPIADEVHAYLRSIEDPKLLLDKVNNAVELYRTQDVDGYRFAPGEGGDFGIKCNEAYNEIEGSYANLRETQKHIESTQEMIRDINKTVIKPELFEYDRAALALALSKDELKDVPGVKELLDLFKQQTAVKEKSIKLHDQCNQRKQLAENFVNEEKRVKKEIENRNKIRIEYEKIKGSTDAMDAKIDKVTALWKEHQELKLMNDDIKDNMIGQNGMASQAREDFMEALAVRMYKFADTAEVGRDSIFSDSTQYSDMIKSVKALFTDDTTYGHGNPVLKEKDPVKIKEALDNIAACSDAYLKKKKKQWRPFPSTQRKTRLDYAEKLKSFAEMSSKQLEGFTVQLMGLPAKYGSSVSKIENELNKAGNVNDFVKNVVQPKAAARLRAFEVFKAQKAKQNEQKQSEQKQNEQKPVEEKKDPVLNNSGNQPSVGGF